MNDVERFLRVLVEPGATFEVRAPKCRQRSDAPYKGTASGYFTFDTISEATKLLSKLDADGLAPGIYVTLNPVVESLLGRAANRLNRSALATTGDTEVASRRRLLIDADPVRPAGISSTDAELAAAESRIRQVREYLAGSGWPVPLLAMSGNGYHLIYAIDLSAEDDGLVKRVLEALAAQFDDDAVKIDTSVHNAARITKAIGTVARKGDEVVGVRGCLDRPHRRSRIIECSERLGVVPADMLRALADSRQPEPRPRTAHSQAGDSMFDRFESTPEGVEAYLTRHGVSVKGRKPSDKGTWLLLDRCPVKPDCVSTGQTDIAVGVQTNGVICYVNKHNRGQDLTWRDVREALEPGYAAFAEVQANGAGMRVYTRPSASQPSKPAVAAEAKPAPQPVGDWPDPQPLPDLMPSVPEFDPGVLPAVVRPWVEDIADRVQCPMDFVAAGVFVSLGSAVGREIAIRPKQFDDFQIVPNLWGAAVGPPSVMKTPALSEAMRPLKHLELKARKEHAEAVKQSAADAALAKIRADVAKHDVRTALREGKEDVSDLMETVINAEVEPPVRRRFIVQDPTVEKLGELLNENPRGLLLFRDELTGFLRNLDRDGRENDRAFYLEAWNGIGGYTYDRIGRGTIDIDSCCVSILGGIQPGPFMSYLGSKARKGAGDDGFIQRFQFLVWPDITDEWRHVDRWPDSAARQAASDLYLRLAGANRFDVGAEVDAHDERRIAFLRFDPEAQQHFNAWWMSLEARLRSDDMPEPVQAHLAKYRKLVPALALVSHLADGRTGAVTAGPLDRAIRLAAYLEGHSARTYAGVMLADVAVARRISRRLRKGLLPGVFAARDLQRKQWSGLTDHDEIEAGLAVLVDFDWLRAFHEAPNGKGRVRFEVNPKVVHLPPDATDRADKCPFVSDVSAPKEDFGPMEPGEEDGQWTI